MDVVLSAGLPVAATSRIAPAAEAHEVLIGAFAWERGAVSFEATPVVPAAPLDIARILRDGIGRHYDGKRLDAELPIDAAWRVYVQAPVGTLAIDALETRILELAAERPTLQSVAATTLLDADALRRRLYMLHALGLVGFGHGFGFGVRGRRRTPTAPASLPLPPTRAEEVTAVPPTREPRSTGVGAGGPDEGPHRDRGRDARTLAERAMLLLEEDPQKNAREAHALVREAREIDPKHPLIYVVLGMLMEHLRNYERALPLYQYALAQDPRCDAAKRRIAELEEKRRRQ